MRARLFVLVVVGALSVACGPSAVATSGPVPQKQEVANATATTPPQVVVLEATPSPTPAQAKAAKSETAEAAIAAILAEAEEFIDKEGKPFKKSNVDGPAELLFTTSAKQMEYQGQKILWYHIESKVLFNQIDGSLFWDELQNTDDIFFTGTHEHINVIPFDVMYITLSLGDRPWLSHLVILREAVILDDWFTPSKPHLITEKKGPPPWVASAK